MRILVAIAFCWCCLAGNAAAQPRVYAMADLEALARDAAWLELLSHMQDIAPAERTPRWRALLEQAAMVVVRDPGLFADPYEALHVTQFLLQTYPQLRAVRPFMEQRAALGLQMIPGCLRDDGPRCRSLALNFVRADPDNAELAFQLGLAVRRSTSAHHAAVPFFHLALQTAPTTDRCGVDDVAMAVVSALALDPARSEARLARELVMGACWPQLRTPVLAALADGGHTARNACPGLLATGVLRGLKLKRCQRIAQQ